eukprot:SAG11_NODE_425_length_9589_cov_69.915701_5_plen_43_part_00
MEDGDLFQAYPNGRLYKSMASFFERRFGDKAFGEGECHRPKN